MVSQIQLTIAPFQTLGIIRSLTVALLLSVTISACSTFPDIDARNYTKLTKVQYCAIGYDLARQIYERISLREVVIIAPKRKTPCEVHSLNYLKLAGFKIDDTFGAETFDITLSPAEGSNVTAVATVGQGLKIARVYKPADTGVYPVTDVSIYISSPNYKQ